MTTENNNQVISVPCSELKGLLDGFECAAAELKRYRKQEAERAEQLKKKQRNGTDRQDAVLWLQREAKKQEKLAALDVKRRGQWRSRKAKGELPPKFQPLSKLTGCDWRVVNAICRALEPQGRYAAIRQETLTKRVGVSERQIIRSIKRLEAAGLILVERQHQKRYPTRFGINHYVPALWATKTAEKSGAPGDLPGDSESPPFNLDLTKDIKDSSTEPSPLTDIQPPLAKVGGSSGTGEKFKTTTSPDKEPLPRNKSPLRQPTVVPLAPPFGMTHLVSYLGKGKPKRPDALEGYRMVRELTTKGCN